MRETGELDFNQNAKLSIAAKQRLAPSFDLNHFVFSRLLKAIFITDNDPQTSIKPFAKVTRGDF